MTSYLSFMKDDWINSGGKWFKSKQHIKNANSKLSLSLFMCSNVMLQHCPNPWLQLRRCFLLYCKLLYICNSLIFTNVYRRFEDSLITSIFWHFMIIWKLPVRDYFIKNSRIYYNFKMKKSRNKRNCKNNIIDSYWNLKVTFSHFDCIAL